MRDIQPRSWVHSVSLYNELKDTQSNRAKSKKSAINIKIIIKKRANDSWFFYDFFNDFLHFYELNFFAKKNLHLSTVCVCRERFFSENNRRQWRYIQYAICMHKKFWKEICRLYCNNFTFNGYFSCKIYTKLYILL
jgi:hypothetical protein